MLRALLVYAMIAMLASAQAAWGEGAPLITLILESQGSVARPLAGAGIAGSQSRYVEQILRHYPGKIVIESDSFARAVKRVEIEANVCVFPLSRLRARQDRFAWIGVVQRRPLYLYVRSSDAGTLKSLKDFLGTGRTLGTISHQASHMVVQDMVGLTLAPVTATELNFRKLVAGRIDGLISNVESADAMIKGPPPLDVVAVEKVADLDLELACNRASDPRALAALRAAHAANMP